MRRSNLKRIASGVAFVMTFFFVSSLPVFAKPPEPDGSNLNKAIFIANASDYSQCHDLQCLKAEYSKSAKQEYDYIVNKYGERGKAWEFQGQDDIPPGTEIQYNREGFTYDRKLGGRYYDKYTIVAYEIGEEKTFYFDITEPYLEVIKYQAKLAEENKENPPPLY